MSESQYTRLKEKKCNSLDAVIAVVIPSYRVTQHILGVIDAIGSEVSLIYVIDDKCPDGSGDYVAQSCADPRVRILRHEVNQGVGGAVMTGYRAAVADGAEVIVKIDGDGQMDPSLMPKFVYPIVNGAADYTKGNRFFDLEKVSAMPKVRLFGNAVLSLMCKLSSGYWNIFDPTNGYTAIHADVVRHLPLNRVSTRYFFETDLLFRLNTLRAVVVDIPMDAKYADEISNLKVRNVLWEFLFKHVRNFFKRLFYNYYLRDMSLASLELPLGCLMIIFGVVYGACNWVESMSQGVSTPPGTVMFSALPVILGFQLVLGFVGYDVSSVPSRPFHRLVEIRRLSKRT